MALRLTRPILALLFLYGCSLPAAAAVEIALYSRELGGNNFPHVFVTPAGTGPAFLHSQSPQLRHFVAELARTTGLRVEGADQPMKKPRSFLRHVRSANAGLLGSRRPSLSPSFAAVLILAINRSC